MKNASLWIDADDGVRLFCRRWMPDDTVFPVPRGVVQIVHGMAEHSLRYEYVASRLCASGFEVWADDHRGHGETARGGVLGYIAESDGFFRVVRDLRLITDRIRRERPKTPLFLLGHSWGSFLAQSYAQDEGRRLSGCILSGTRGPEGPVLEAGVALARLVAALKGPRRHSALLRLLADGNYNKQFRPARTPFDWLSRAQSTVDAYVADPLCGFRMSAGFYRDLFEGLSSIQAPGAVERIPRTLPMYVIAGSQDPVGGNGKGPAALVEAYRSAGLTDLEFVLYPDARHEILNETNRDEVIGALVSWLDRHVGPAA
jgi:alpha-beta hydrolase superfamily lysophospholipase